MKDFLKLYSGLVERCFNDCVNDFTSKTLSSKEASRKTLTLEFLVEGDLDTAKRNWTTMSWTIDRDRN